MSVQVITPAEAAEFKAKRVSLVESFSDRYGLEANRMMATLRATVIRPDKNGNEASNEQIASFLVVANQHDLNPFTKEIHAFLGKGGAIVCVVGLDGWAKKVNQHPQFDGMDFEQDDEKCTCRMYRKDRTHPVVVTEYHKECVRATEPWASHPKRMLRHKALIQCARIAFSFAGIYDPDEAEAIIANEEIDVTPQRLPDEDGIETGINNAQGRKLVSPVKLRKVVEGLLKAVADKNGKELWAIVNENEMTKDVDSARYIWSKLRSYEARSIHDLMSQTRQYRDGLDIGAWAIELLNRSDTADGLLANYRAIEDAYAENDLTVPEDLQTVFQDRKQALAVP